MYFKGEPVRENKNYVPGKLISMLLLLLVLKSGAVGCHGGRIRLVVKFSVHEKIRDGRNLQFRFFPWKKTDFRSEPGCELKNKNERR